MRRKAVHLIAAIGESLRFAAVAFLAFSVGALADSSVSNLLRYAAAPQLLFAAGFFFMWLDPDRYFSYKPLLLVGKLAGAVCFLPLAGTILRDPSARGSTFGLPGLGVVLAFLIALADIASLCVLALSAGAPAGNAKPTPPGVDQGPDDIERVEG